MSGVPIFANGAVTAAFAYAMSAAAKKANASESTSTKRGLSERGSGRLR